MYEKGKGVRQDYSAAFEWYKKAAEAGNLSAMKNLALMYEKGRGVERNALEAEKWREKAKNSQK